MGKELNFLPLKYKAMGKESNFLFSLNAQLSPTWGRSQSPESKLSFSTNSSPKCKAILPHNFTNPSHSICREGFVPIMQNLYKSFPTNESLLFLFFFFFLSSFFILCLFHFIRFIYFCLFNFFWGFFFFFFFFKTWNSSPKEKIYSPAFGGNNRRIDAPGHITFLRLGLTPTLIVMFAINFICWKQIFTWTRYAQKLKIEGSLHDNFLWQHIQA